MNISDHGELDHIDQKTGAVHYRLTEADTKTADDARHAIAQQRYMLNTQERVRAEQAKSRAMKEQADQDYLKHNPTLDGQS